MSAKEAGRVNEFLVFVVIFSVAFATFVYRDYRRTKRKAFRRTLHQLGYTEQEIREAIREEGL